MGGRTRTLPVMLPAQVMAAPKVVIVSDNYPLRATSRETNATAEGKWGTAAIVIGGTLMLKSTIDKHIPGM